jgi:lysophospholipase L1-like esterase
MGWTKMSLSDITRWCARALFFIALLMIGAGLIYNPFYMVKLFSSTQALPKFYYMFCWLVSIFFVVGGIILIIARKYVLQKPGEFLILLSSVILVFGILELGLRIYFFFGKPEEQKVYLSSGNSLIMPVISRHHYLGYALTPNYISFDGQTHHNAYGFRGKPFTIKKPKGTYRIVALGGSTTYTQRVKDDTKTFPFLLETILNKKYHYEHVEVINAGVPGYESFQTLINLQFKVLELEPDLVIYYHGVNDVGARLVSPETYRSDNSHFRRPWEARSNPLFLKSILLRLIMQRLTGQSMEPAISHYFWKDNNLEGLISEKYHPILGDTPINILKKNKPIYFKHNLESAIAISKRQGIKFLVLTWAYSTRMGDFIPTQHYQFGIKEQNDLIRNRESESGVWTYDFSRDMPNEPSYWKEGRHVNEKGAQKKASLIAKYIHNNRIIEEN